MAELARVKGILVVMMCAFIIHGTAHARGIIDVHSHNVLPEFVRFLEDKGAALDENWPLPSWDADSHLEFMRKSGIGTSILSMPAPQPYFGDSVECRREVRKYNLATAALKAGYPGKFLFCAALPLPDVEAAVQEAVYALDTLKADGVKLATNSRGQYLGDPALDSLMSVLNERKAVVILHPHKPVPVNESLIASMPLAAYEYPAETTRAVLNMIAHNVPARFPDIRFVVPHCGSFLPLAIPRAGGINRFMSGKGMAAAIDWEANLRNLYYDLAGNPSKEVLKSLLGITSPDHLLYGSDYPYQPPEVLAAGLSRLKTILAEDKELAAYADGILGGNAASLFNIEYRKQ